MPRGLPWDTVGESLGKTCMKHGCRGARGAAAGPARESHCTCVRPQFPHPCDAVAERGDPPFMLPGADSRGLGLSGQEWADEAPGSAGTAHGALGGSHHFGLPASPLPQRGPSPVHCSPQTTAAQGQAQTGAWQPAGGPAPTPLREAAPPGSP